MNTDYRKPLPNSELDYFDTREAAEAIKPGCVCEPALYIPGIGRAACAPLRSYGADRLPESDYRS